MDADSLILRARRRLGARLRRAGLLGYAYPTSGPRGEMPTVTPEQTHYGPVVDRLVERLRRNQRRYGVNPDYDLVRERFDHYHAVLQSPAMENQPANDPIRVFLRNGPDVWFDPEINFSTRKYLQRYPERREGRERSPYLEWLKRGKNAGEIADPSDGVEPMAGLLGLDVQELVAEAVRLRTDMTQRLRTGTLGEMFAKAVELEPLIGEAWRETTRAKQLPLRNDSIAMGAAAIHAAHQDAGFRRARIVIVSDRPDGGAGGFDAMLARALAVTVAAEDIVVIYTDESGPAPAHRFPAGVRTIDLASRLVGIAPLISEQTLVSLVRSFAAEAVINVDSRLFYAALAPYGKALVQSERVFLTFVGARRGPLGVPENWGLRWLYPAFDYITGFLTDSARVRELLTEHFCLSPTETAKIHVLAAGVQPEIAVVGRPSREGRRPTVAWQASRERPSVDAVLKLAEAMPDVDFRLYGIDPADVLGKVADGTPEEPAATVPDNITAVATPVNVRVDVARVDVWLHNSTSDTVPTVLLDVAMTETPIVAVEVPATVEVLTAEGARLVAGVDDATAFEKALREVLADPGAAAARAHALRERLILERPMPSALAVELLLRPVSGEPIEADPEIAEPSDDEPSDAEPTYAEPIDPGQQVPPAEADQEEVG